jgi:very-short-patch-repair endonuclease
MPTDNGARAVLAAGVQQRLVRAADLAAVADACHTLHRRSLVRATLADIVRGAEALSELDFCRLVRRFRLPEPDRQVERRDGQGCRRWLDAYWDKARLIAEIDGLWHTEAAAWWADMRRDNHLVANGYRVLRFPAFAVRDEPEVVAGQIITALGLPGAGL